MKYVLTGLNCTLEEYSDKALEEYLITHVKTEVAKCSSLRLCGEIKELSINRPTIKRPLGLSRYHHRVYLQALTLNLGLGNRANLPGFDRAETCTICAEYGIQTKLDEIHFAIR